MKAVRCRAAPLAALALAALGQAACGWFDYSGSRFECGDGGSCPAGLVCTDGYCVELLSATGSGTTPGSSCSLPSEPTPGSCGQLCQDCAGTTCCPGLICSTLYTCLVGSGQSCSQGADCASGSCTGSQCACSPLEAACSVSTDCCAGLYCAFSTCRRAGGSPCTSDENCTTDQCSAGSCACEQQYEECVVDADCCDGSCSPPSGQSDFGSCD